MIAVGVASPSASGQVITITAIANKSDCSTSRPTTAHQIRNVTTPAVRATKHEPERGAVGEALPGRL